MKTHNKFFVAAGVAFVITVLACVFATAIWPLSPIISMLAGGCVGSFTVIGLIEKYDPLG